MPTSIPITLDYSTGVLNILKLARGTNLDLYFFLSSISPCHLNMNSN